MGKKIDIDDVHRLIMIRWKNDFGSIHKDVIMDAYTISGFVTSALTDDSEQPKQRQSDKSNDTE